MNKICKRYTSEIKALFPIFGKNERVYFSKLKTDVNNFCNEGGVSTMEELYTHYGMPIEVVRNYYSFFGMDNMIKRIRLRNHINSAVIIALLIFLILIAMYCVKL